MMGISDSERISMMRSAVLVDTKHACDRQTDGIGVAYTRYSIYAVARKNAFWHFHSKRLTSSTVCVCALHPVDYRSALIALSVKWRS